MATYHFDTDHATDYGLPEAVVLYNLAFWIGHNRDNGTHQHDALINGEVVTRTWTYNSTRAFAEQFPWWSRDQIRRILKKLVDKEVVIEGNFNTMKMDRTTWYAFVDEEKMLRITSPCGENAQPFGDSAQSCGENAQPIPDSNHTDSNQHISPPIIPQGGSAIGSVSSLNKPPSQKERLAAEFDECWAEYPNKQGKANALKAYLKHKPQKQDVLDGIQRYIAYVASRRLTGFPDLNYANGSTWFHQQRWQDECKVSADPSTPPRKVNMGGRWYWVYSDGSKKSAEDCI